MVNLFNDISMFGAEDRNRTGTTLSESQDFKTLDLFLVNLKKPGKTLVCRAFAALFPICRKHQKGPIAQRSVRSTSTKIGAT